MVVVQVGNALLQLGAAPALFCAEAEQVNVGVQRELVHGVDAAHVIENKEENGGSLGTPTVGLFRNKIMTL